MKTKIREEEADAEARVNEKILTYNGTEYELTRVQYTFRDETAVQEGVLVRIADDKTDDGVLYGNGWNIDKVNDEDDLENILTSGSDGTIYFHKTFDCSYRMDD